MIDNTVSPSHVDNHTTFNDSIFTTTIYIVVDSTTTDSEHGVSTNSSRNVISRNTKSTAKDVTTRNSITTSRTNLAVAQYIHISMVLYKAALAAAIDRALDLGVGSGRTSTDGHIGIGG